MDRRRFSQLAVAASLTGRAIPAAAESSGGLTEDSIATAWLARSPWSKR